MASVYPYIQNQMAGMPMMQQSYGQPTYAPVQPPMQSNVIPVDGEVGAKAYMIPSGSTGPIALWDTNDSVIYLRTFNAAGMPNPLQKLRYVEEQPTPILPAQSGAGAIDTSNFATREDLEAIRQEIRALANGHGSQNNQNGSQIKGRQG